MDFFVNFNTALVNIFAICDKKVLATIPSLLFFINRNRFAYRVKEYGAPNV